MLISEENYLMHYGILRKSGRYPWGSGGSPEQRSQDFLKTVDDLKSKGLSETEIATGLDLRNDNGRLWNSTDFRASRSIARNQVKQAQIRTAQKLRDSGMSNVAIGTEMRIPESTVRTLLVPGAQDKADKLSNTKDVLRSAVDRKKFVDISGGTENHMGISDSQLKVAVASLREEGYKLHYVKVQQLGTGKETNTKVLTKEGVPYTDVIKARDEGRIQLVTDYTPDSGRTYYGIQPPISIKSARVAVRYGPDGGTKADGVIYVRPGVDDLSLGKNRYAQVRIMVDNSHYLKGMAVYKNDLPDGVDLLFNTNKSDTGNKLDAMKKIKDDPDNPFGAIVHQIPKRDAHGNELKDTVSSAMNLVNEEGDWETWSRNLSTQFLSKQSPVLAKTQLDMAYERRRNELDTINSLTNPAVKRKLLDEFAEKSDSAAVQMKAAALPRQATRVILPIDSLKDNEVYAPSFRPGERVVLVRHPHGGPFEIPELVVNNRNKEAISTLKGVEDAIGINSKVAERLSGADFDGDQVLVIPNNQGKVRTAPALEGLKNFDAKRDYAPYEGMTTVDGGKWNSHTKEVEYGPKGPAKDNMQHKMGDVSNLITDMTIKNASNAELAAAVRHSMVVIDAEKHHLDIKSSYEDNNIANLKKKYQFNEETGRAGGASTLISRAKSPINVNARKQGFRTDPITGEKIYRETGETYVDRKTGETVTKTQRSKKLAETTDASTLSSGTPIEKLYVDYSNSVKALANEARLASLNTKSVPRSPSAAKTYATEVARLDAALKLAERNRPYERQAQILAGATVKAKQEANPDLKNDKEQMKKVRSQALAEARTRVGAKKIPIVISDSEWEAIQQGAISNAKLKRILDNTDITEVKERATPREATVMTSIKVERAKQMLANGYDLADIADQLGVATSTLQSSLKREGK